MASNKIRTNIIISIIFRLFVWDVQCTGRKKAISRSNNRNGVATKKNCVEKCGCVDLWGQNHIFMGLIFLHSQ